MRWCGLAMLWIGAATLVAGPVEPSIYVEVFLAGEKSPQKITGQLTGWDEQSLRITTPRGERSLPWTQLTPASAFVVRSRLIDRTIARDWLELGRFGLSVGAGQQARTALATAVRMDPSLKREADELLAAPDNPPGEGGKDASALPEPTAQTPAATDGEATPPPPTPRAQPGRPRRGEPATPVKKFEPASEEDHQRAIEQARRRAREVETELELTLVEIQTDHFILFTDWDPREHGFLRENLEAAYTLVSKQFDLSPKDNIFVGKLPVFMFARRDDFLRFARELDDFGASDGVQGYYRSHGDGLGHMAMPKPDLAHAGGNVRQAELQWAYILTHEFVHAFVARYRTNQRIPRWLNEGVAEVIAQSRFKRPDARTAARIAASSHRDYLELFDDDRMPGGDDYPVMMSMVEMLAVGNRRKFIQLFNAIKDGDEPEEALLRIYGVNHEGLVHAWRQYAARMK